MPAVYYRTAASTEAEDFKSLFLASPSVSVIENGNNSNNNSSGKSSFTCCSSSTVSARTEFRRRRHSIICGPNFVVLSRSGKCMKCSRSTNGILSRESPLNLRRGSGSAMDIYTCKGESRQRTFDLLTPFVGPRLPRSPLLKDKTTSIENNLNVDERKEVRDRCVCLFTFLCSIVICP